jgi:glycosyltransferase involved in cell wall biosynthesis
MIFFDITKTQNVRHRSGLARMSERLRTELGAAASAANWQEIRERAGARDWFVTSELFAEYERPGMSEFVRSRRCRTAAIFADAIPIKHPTITWPHSVARHPHYMKALAGFERVWAISEASRDELHGYWAWLGISDRPRIDVLPLGADFDGSPRVTKRGDAMKGGVPALLCVGILEPRKNQVFLLEACAELWRAGLKFELHLMGRVNPHFGKPVVARIREMKKEFRGLQYHEAADDATLAALYARVRATVVPTIAEGCGLPLLESLWRGVPCVCSDLSVLRENADGGGCVTVTLNDRAAWVQTLRDVLTDEARHARLVNEATTRVLPTWAEAARVLREGLEDDDAVITAP